MNNRNRKRPGYRETKVGWIPEDWKAEHLVSVVDINRESLSEGNTEDNYSFYYLTLSDVSEGNFSKPEKKIRFNLAPSRARRKFTKGDVLLSTVRPNLKGFGFVDFNANEFICSTGFVVLHPKKNLDGKFIYHYLYSYNADKYFYACVVGSNYPALNNNDVEKLWIPLPPEKERTKIAEILTTWDKAVELVGNQIEAKQRLKKGLMQQLLTGKMRFPGFDDEWDSVKLGEIGDFSKGSGIRKSELLEYGIPCIRYGEIYTSHDFIIYEFYSFISLEVASTSTKIFNGDILFAGSGETPEEIGKCVAYLGEEDAYAGGDVIVLRLSKGDPRYMGYLLNHDVVNRQKYMHGQGHSVVHIYSRFLKDIEIPFPPIEEQKKIAGLLNAVDHEIDRLYHKLFFLRQHKQGLMQKLLTGEVKVNV